jgi:hypothetical protein
MFNRYSYFLHINSLGDLKQKRERVVCNLVEPELITFLWLYPQELKFAWTMLLFDKNTVDSINFSFLFYVHILIETIMRWVRYRKHNNKLSFSFSVFCEKMSRPLLTSSENVLLSTKKNYWFLKIHFW